MGHEHTQDSNPLCARCKDYPKCAAIMVAQNGTAEPRMMSCRGRAMAHRVAAAATGLVMSMELRGEREPQRVERERWWNKRTLRTLCAFFVLSEVFTAFRNIAFREPLRLRTGP